MPYKDHREFFKALEKEGDLLKISKQVDWDIEAGAIGRRNYEQYGPCLLFENIKDYPKGYRISNGTSGTWPRVAMALGLPREASVREIYHTYDEKLGSKIPPTVVDRRAAPCKQNIMMGDDINLNKFPAPMIHEGDGGRYIGTWDIIICKDPVTNWTNWGMYRFMIHNKNWLTGWPQTTSQFAKIFKERYLPENKPMPVAIVLGADPVSHLIATAPIPLQENEAEFSGGLGGASVELVKCETSDLMVPANAEIVIEAEMQPDKVAPDGPFGEYPGFRSGTMCEGIAVKVTAITHRNDPILTMIALGTPPDDSNIAASLTAAVSMKKGLLRRGLPVTDVFVPPEGVTHLIVIGVEEGGPEIAKKVLEYFCARRVMTNKHIMVGPDVDVFNMNEVLHAFATVCHPGRGIHYEWYEGRANSLTPMYNLKERAALKGCSVIFDATWPPDWNKELVPIKSCFKGIYGQQIQQKVIDNWKNYGFK
ncbi:MAG: UbiD family decarboxylase [Desulfobacteraceae bacterium]|nr:MAG: UbiD family decarboxylase [Desulfobacteraceae bacterium]